MPGVRPLYLTLCPTLDREIAVERGTGFQKSLGKDAQSHHRRSSNFKVNIYGQPFTLSKHIQGLGNRFKMSLHLLLVDRAPNGLLEITQLML